VGAGGHAIRPPPSLPFTLARGAGAVLRGCHPTSAGGFPPGGGREARVGCRCATPHRRTRHPAAAALSGPPGARHPAAPAAVLSGRRGRMVS